MLLRFSTGQQNHLFTDHGLTHQLARNDIKSINQSINHQSYLKTPQVSPTIESFPIRLNASFLSLTFCDLAVIYLPTLSFAFKVPLTYWLFDTRSTPSTNDTDTRDTIVNPILLMPSYGSLHSPSLRKMNGNMEMASANRGGMSRMSMENIIGDPFALATISIATVRCSI